MSTPSMLPLYSQVKEYVIHEIEEGALGAGSQLPSQRELCEKFGISLMTARRAINELISEGVIYAIPGKGLFVANKKQAVEADPLISFTDDMVQRGLHPTSQLLESNLTQASPFLAKTLGVETHAELAYFRRLRLADGRPMAVQANYIVYRYCPGILTQPVQQEGLFNILRNRYGLRLTDTLTTVESALASEEVAELLQMSLPAPLLVTEQVTFLENGRAVEFAHTTYCGDRYLMTLRGGGSKRE